MNHDNNLPRWFTNEEAQKLFESICKIASFFSKVSIQLLKEQVQIQKVA